MKRTISFLENGFNLFILAIAVILLIFFVRAKLNPNEIPSFMGYRLMNVLSGSMRPKLQPGDMILTKPIDIKKIQKGDVVTYMTNEGMFVTHRITKIENVNGRLTFKTKGDANNIEDEGVVYESMLVGIMIFKIPYGGFTAAFIKSPFGIAIIVFLAINILSASYIKKALDELKVKETK